MNMERQMKAALDGKFFTRTGEGKVECRNVSQGHTQPFTDNAVQKSYGVKAGLESAARRKVFLWTRGKMQWLRENHKRLSIKTCAAELGAGYDSTYQKILKIRKEEKMAAS